MRMLFVVFVLLVGCHTEQTACSCFEPGLTITAPADVVTGITTSGPGCTDATITCVDNARGGFVDGCTQYRIAPNGAGACNVHIELGDSASRDETREIEDHRADTCCGGYDVTPAADAHISI